MDEAVAWPAVIESEDGVEAVLSLAAAAVALELLGELDRTTMVRREGLRRLGARALLRVGGTEDEDRGEALRLAASLAKDGLRALAGREAPRASFRPSEGASPTTHTPAVSERELALLTGAHATDGGERDDGFEDVDGLELAEIALRVRASSAARHELAWLQRLGRREVALRDGSLGGVEAATPRPALRLAAEGAAPMRDPGEGTAIGEFVVGGERVELVRFADGVLAAYAERPVVVALGGSAVGGEGEGSVGVSRASYAEARLVGGGRVHVVVGDASIEIELGV